jgi:hypothetical protein
MTKSFTYAKETGKLTDQCIASVQKRETTKLNF